MKGIYRHPSVGTVEVALKVLKDRESPNPRHEIMKEADTMSQLDHENIVRLIGVCVYACMCACVYACVYMCVCVWSIICWYTYVCVCVYASFAGICASEPMMVVMELAELGPLNKYLRKEGP